MTLPSQGWHAVPAKFHHQRDVSGGTNGNGTVFIISPSGDFTNLYAFTGGVDGKEPEAGLVLASDGNFYGTTSLGGTHRVGNVFRITPSGVLTNMYSFTGGADGETPYSGLVQGTDSNFYGTTFSGGTNRTFGTIFKITPSGALTKLYSFTGGADGAAPAAGLVQGSDGDFYGTTTTGGPYYHGTVFKITSSGALTTLHSFTGGADGANPTAALVQGADYSTWSRRRSRILTIGTTRYNMIDTSDGTIFRLEISNPPPLTLNWSSPASVVYGTSLTSNQLDAGASVGGVFSYGPTNGTVLDSGTHTLSVVFTPSDTLDYSAVTDTVSLVVLPAALTVTAASYSRLYNASNPVFIGTISGLTNGDNITATYSCSANPGSPVGAYPIVPSLVDPNNRQTNYTVNLINGTLMISQATPIISWTSPAPILYGSSLGSNQLDAGANVPGSFDYSPTNGVVLDAGTNVLLGAFTPSDAVDYASVTNTAGLVVLPGGIDNHG